MLRVYLAAPYRQKEQMRQYASELRQLGVFVTSRWLAEKEEEDSLRYADVTRRKNAIQDFEDVCAANRMIFFTDPTKTIVRAGRHVEFGMALALGTPIWIVGQDRENIFHYLPSVEHFDSWESVRDRVESCL